MSEVPAPAPKFNRPEGMNPPLPPASPPHGASRNMADIARLFLDGARNTPPMGAPRRVPPQQRAVINRADENIQHAPDAIPSQVESKAAALGGGPARPIESSFELPKVMLGLAGGSDAASWRLLVAAGAGLAREHATTVCLMGVRDNAFVLDLIGHESADDVPRVAPGAGMVDVQVARALFTLRNSVGMWLIAAPDARSASFSQLIEGVPHWLAATSTQNERVVAVYQQIKQAVAIAGPVTTPRAYVVADDAAAATAVHTRLRTATKEFLRKDLYLAGTGPACSREPEAARVSAIALKHEGPKAIWAAVIDELFAPDTTHESEGDEKLANPNTPEANGDVEEALGRVAAAAEDVHENSATLSAASNAVFDQLSHVLDPEERAALTAEFAESGPTAPSTIPSVPPSLPPATSLDSHDPVISTPLATEEAVREKIVEQALALPASAARGAVTLRAFDLPEAEDRDRNSQWHAVERSIRDLVADSVLLDARPPMSWARDCCIALDATGGLHVWTLYQDGVSWYALREWASEHRNLLALTRRDLVLNRETDVTVHIVLPLEEGRSSGSNGQGDADIRSLFAGRAGKGRISVSDALGAVECSPRDACGADRLRRSFFANDSGRRGVLGLVLKFDDFSVESDAEECPALHAKRDSACGSN